ncbi:MAG: hydantoinase/oxoprolinase family protein [Chloroflexi bacterium]|nr:hydantoinase/oxoprolinase family protein [Chloroflexota bacterium]
MPFTVGIDTGGTFTDCVVINERGEVSYDKALSTPHDLTEGVLNSIGNAAGTVGLSSEALLKDTTVLGHGTTVATNRLFTRTGSKVGLITTLGHEDAILIGRVHQKVAGLVEKEITHAVRLDKPEPIVPRSLIKGVTERVDYKGQVIVPLRRQEVVDAVKLLAAEGVEAIAVCLLWSFMNPSHEQEVREIIKGMYPSVFVTISSDLTPIIGEYERTATSVLNAYLGPMVYDYILGIDGKLREKGLRYPLLVMQSMGGVVPAQEVSEKAVQLVSSGPVGGVIGAAVLGKLLGYDHVITTDVGGTSFDVGIIAGGGIPLAREPVFEQYHVLTPIIDITSIGAGGGSIAQVDPRTRLMRVGPRSAGSYPGPVCYNLGGTEPTVTDADVILGRINPDYFLGGRMQIDQSKAVAAVKEKIADPLNMTVVEAAKGILDIVDAHMADLVRKVSIERGHDPRDFVLFAYGGSGPTHVGVYAMDVGVRAAVVSPYAPVFSAFGIAGSDTVRAYIKSEPMVAPFDPGRLNSIFRTLEGMALDDLRKGGASETAATISRSMEMRFRRQTHQLRVPVPQKDLTGDDLEQLVVRFQDLYEQVYGKGTAYKEAGIEVTTFSVTSTVQIPKPSLKRHDEVSPDASAAFGGKRPVYFHKDFLDTPIYRGEKLRAGNVIEGPAVIENVATTLPVHPGQRVRIDPYLNMVIEFE